MKIQYCSDLHLEFKENKKHLHSNPIIPTGEILLLAGDIVPFAVMDKHNDFFDFVADNFEQVYWVPGNHEYYYFDVASKNSSFHEKIRSNVSLINNVSVIKSDVKFIFSTLWSKISPVNMRPIQQGMSDFKVIKRNGQIFNPHDFNELHEASLHFIEREIQNLNSGKVIVVTHHVPTFMNYPNEYIGSDLNEAFAIELFDLIEKAAVDYWLYGHNHRNQPDFDINGTRVITNQLGYVKYGENQQFDVKKCINV
ncbi:MAG: metallophosphoesterase [Bacteroidetes bacterium]|nr:metallophosphoesterase [Bacteroidota bacterium]